MPDWMKWSQSSDPSPASHDSKFPNIIKACVLIPPEKIKPFNLFLLFPMRYRNCAVLGAGSRLSAGVSPSAPRVAVQHISHHLAGASGGSQQGSVCGFKGRSHYFAEEADRGAASLPSPPLCPPLPAKRCQRGKAAATALTDLP